MDNMRIKFLIFLLILSMTIVLGSLGFMYIEGLSLGDALYFCFVSVATVGYGDITPHTGMGRALAVTVILMGIFSMTGLVATLVDIFLIERDRKVRMEKLNMVVGVFFSEAGTRLLRYCTSFDPHVGTLGERLHISGKWRKEDFANVLSTVKAHDYSVDIARANLPELKAFVMSHSELLLRMMENQNLLEHESFTELLRAILHLKEELLYREDFSTLPQSDLDHIAGDIKRAYGMLVTEWVAYMEHLKEYYPYLFSLAVRVNPFNAEASVVVK